jgi:hypothetical protein
MNVQAKKSGDLSDLAAVSKARLDFAERSLPRSTKFKLIEDAPGSCVQVRLS